jgi:single-stranded-DNA-specific exonuclease
MISVSGNNWEEIVVNKRLVEKTKIDNNLSETVSKLIVSRNFDDLEVHSINKNIEITNPFLKNKDFLKSHEIINLAIKNDEKIFILGDYDVDGCVSVSLFVNFFRQIDKEIKYYIPNRFTHGYGASLKLIKELVQEKPDLIIMLDCGSNSHEAINYLNKNKIKTLIIDHHEIYKPYPRVNSLINPKKECDYNEYDYLSAATLSYFFLDSIIKKKKLQVSFDTNLIYVLLSIICDVMPLRKINRIIAINVLKNFDIKKNFMINKIFELNKIKRPFDINDLGFLIGPILNSAGRLDDPNKVVDLLCSKNDLVKENIINKLLITNEKRKKIEKDTIDKINLKELKQTKDGILIVYKNFFNEGIIGIIASRLKDFFNKPCIVLTKSGNLYKASARSTLDFNIGKYIKQAIDKEMIINGGGHNLAAGFSIKKHMIPSFKEFINSMIFKKKVDLHKKFLSKISLNAVNKEFFDNLQSISPFGSGNSSPSFLIEKVKITKPKILKNRFISCLIKSSTGKSFAAISFDLLNSEITKNLLYNKKEMSLIVQIKENQWNNKKNLQLIVVDVIQFPNKA